MVVRSPANADGSVREESKMMKRAVAAGLAGMLLLAACGDDGDNAGAKAGATDASYTSFCQAEVKLEAAIASEDPDAAQSSMTALSAATPAAAKATVDKTIAEAQKFLAANDLPTPEFNAAYGDMIGVVKDKCGFGELDVTAKEYQFSGLSGAVKAGPQVVSLANKGTEYHEIELMRVNDGVTLSATDLVALPEDEAMSKVSLAGSAFAAPGETGYTVADLQAGRYVAVCFLPVGSTASAMSGGQQPDGPPHAMQGMVSEFTVS
jgi:hypothetical protein